MKEYVVIFLDKEYRFDMPKFYSNLDQRRFFAEKDKEVLLDNVPNYRCWVQDKE